MDTVQASMVFTTFSVISQFDTILGDVIAADNFTGKPEAMVQILKSVPVLAWQWMSV